MALIEVNKCNDINCKYIQWHMYCPEDWFDDEMYAECSHPKAPKRSFLGDDKDENCLVIPDWCPKRR